MLKGETSNEFLEVVEDCKVILLNTEKFRAHTKENIRLLRLWNDGITDAFLEAIDRIEFFVGLSPEERYKALLDTTPDLINRVQQKHLASYIGVTTVSLSRIRSRVSKTG